MNGELAKNREIIHSLLTLMTPSFEKMDATLGCVVCPPSLYIAQVGELLADTPIVYGAQDVSTQENGAYTGDISATMLADLGCQYVIVGHSERRQYHHETDHDIRIKIEQASKHNITPIYCIGETLEQRNSKQHQHTVKQQIEVIFAHHSDITRQLIIAYEPIWAIGTGETATTEQAQTMHAWIRHVIAKYDLSLSTQITLLYGGSVNQNNAKALARQTDIDGFLVGGASLQPQNFVKICEFFL